MTREEWIQILEYIGKDMQQPLEYLPGGLLLGLVSVPVLWLWGRLRHRCMRTGRFSEGGIGAEAARRIKTDWVRLGFLVCCIVYVFITLNMVFFSREPGSRTEVNMQLLGTWSDNPKSRGYVIENIILFLPFGILFPCAVPVFRKVWSCVPAACLCSIGIEWVQYVTERGYCQLDDVVMNTLGAGAGWLLYRTVLHNGIRQYEKKQKERGRI